MAHVEEMMEKLKQKKGEEFDKAFIEAMITHHKQAIKMARMAKDKAHMADLKKMSTEIIEKQSKEIKKLEEMR